jgi:hypothetical protein
MDMIAILIIANALVDLGIVTGAFLASYFSNNWNWMWLCLLILVSGMRLTRKGK